MRETRPSGSEGGVARKRHPYPYLRSNPAEGGHSKTLRACFSSHPDPITPELPCPQAAIQTLGEGALNWRKTGDF